MGIVGWIVIGALAGGFATLIMGRNENLGWLVTIVIGIAGAFVGGTLWAILSGSAFVASFNLMTLMISIVGAMIVLLVGEFIARGA